MISIGSCLLLVITQLALLSVSYQDEFDDGSQQSLDDPLSKFWGIADTDTIVGRLFQCRIPPESDAFKGTIVEYDVEGEKPNTLPQWLIFDKKRSMLEGVPTVEDIGDTRINVKAYDSKGKFVSDMFVIDVYPLENDNTDTKKKCRNGEEVMMLAIVIDEDLRNITSSHRISVIRTLARTLSISPSTILLLPQLSSDYSSNIVQENEKSYETNANSSILVWQIGCDDRIWAEQVEVVSLVKKFLKSKTLGDMLHLPISEWRLTTNSYPFRIRRHVSPDPVELDDDTTDDNEDEELEGGEEDEGDIKPSPPSSALQNSLSSVSPMNGTLPLQQSHIENNFTGLPSPTETNSGHTQIYPSKDGDEEDAETDSPNLDDMVFDSKNTTALVFSTPSPCATCESTENSTQTRTEKPNTASTNTRPPPRGMKNLGPFVFKAGQLHSEKIPEDTFIDGEGGNTLNMTLRIVQADECKPDRVWIELDLRTQTLWMLASSDAVSNYEIILEATNSANLSANVSIAIAVQYPQEELLINFEISFHLRLTSENEHLTPPLLLKLIDMISKLNGDTNADKIMLRHVRCDPLTVTWTNITLPLNSCDSATIRKLLLVLIEAERSVKVNARVRQYFDELLVVEKVTWIGKGDCEGVLPKPELGISSKINSAPKVHQHIENITAHVGELLVYQIPENAFYDFDVGSIRECKMTVTLSGQNTLPPDNWLQFDEKNQEIYGLPMNSDKGLTAYTVVLHDDREPEDEGMAARQTIEVKVEPASRKNYNVEFSMTLNSSYASYEQFSRTPMLRRTFIKKLSELFGDEDTSSIVVSGYAPGSLIVIWHNKTLPVHTCPEKEIEQLRKVMLTDKGELTERVNTVLGPEFQALSAMLSPIGICEGGLTRTHVTEGPPNKTSFDIEKFSVASFEYYLREYFVEIIMPIIIIILMMMLAGIVACFLYRRRRGTKWNLHDGSEKRSSRNRGIPVIFQDELEERLETSNKNPIIMKEEKPPLPPPEYQRTLPMATTALLSDFDDPSYHQEGSSYSPRTTERHERDKSSTPTYRKPPPYIPP